MSTFAVATRTREQSLTNLCIAFNAESNAAARYAAFAKKADDEGYRQVASLFRAISRSEQIHAANHAATMLKMGRSHRSTIELPKVKATIENLNAAVDGEFYEVNEMYPGFILEASAEGLTAARRTFRYAIASERGHLRLFLTALEQIEHPDVNIAEMLSRKAAYYVCPECGFTAERIEFDGCPICRHSRDEFELVG